MAFRLDRLFVLLESGSSAVTRKAAACQLGEVQKLHPHELHNLLNRILTYLHSPNWDTRIAAGQAVQAIVSNVPEWDPPASISIKQGKMVLFCYSFDHIFISVLIVCLTDLTICFELVEEGITFCHSITHTGRLTFDKFDVNQIMANSAHLLGSEGKEYNTDESFAGK